MSKTVKKLVPVLATSTLVTGANMEDDMLLLERVLCIYYLLCFRKDNSDVKTLLDSGRKVNAMTPAYASKLGLKVRSTNIGAQKINDSILETFEMTLASFCVKNKLGQARFCQEIFLFANTSVKVILEIPFLILSNANISLAD